MTVSSMILRYHVSPNWPMAELSALSTRSRLKRMRISYSPAVMVCGKPGAYRINVLLVGSQVWPRRSIPRLLASGLSSGQYTQPLNCCSGCGKYWRRSGSMSVVVPPACGVDSAKSLTRSLSSRIRVLASCPTGYLSSQARIPDHRFGCRGSDRSRRVRSLRPLNLSAYSLTGLREEGFQPRQGVRRELDLHVGAQHHGHQIAAVLDDRVALQEAHLAARGRRQHDVARGQHVGTRDALLELDHGSFSGGL